MSEKQRYQFAAAHLVATQLLEALSPICERIVIAGSLRRKRETVSDIEILYTPKMGDGPADDLLAPPPKIDLMEVTLKAWLEEGLIEKRPSKIGVFTWGPKNKLGFHVKSGIPVDFFATTERNWWVSLVIRTGGKNTNLTLTNGAQRLGASLNAYGSGVTYLDTGRIVAATSERHVFELCGVPYLNPEQRA